MKHRQDVWHLWVVGIIIISKNFKVQNSVINPQGRNACNRITPRYANSLRDLLCKQLHCLLPISYSYVLQTSCFRLINDPQLNRKAKYFKENAKISRDNFKCLIRNEGKRNKQRESSSHLKWPEMCFLEEKSCTGQGLLRWVFVVM